MHPILASVSNVPSPSTDNENLPSPLQKNNKNILPSHQRSPYQSDLVDIASSNGTTISILVHSNTFPTITTNVHDCFHETNPLQPFWIQTAYEQYDENASYWVITRRIPKSSLPPDTLILKSIFAPNIKTTTMNHLWKVNIWHCVNGQHMHGIKEYGATCASTV